MARFYPTINENFHGSSGEEIVYEVLRKGLNDRYTVFHSFAWMGTDKQRRTEGEADFVILHPAMGILVVEVKSGGIAYRDGVWYQINRLTGYEKAMDPLQQAAESQHFIINLLYQRLPNLVARPLVGRAAWFTSVVLNKSLVLPPSVSHDILLDSTAFDDVEGALRKAYDFWKANLNIGKMELSPQQFSQVVASLMPSFRIVPAISSIVRDNLDAYIRMTCQQSAVLDFLVEQPVAAIHGLAGTGKTMLALEKAKMLSRMGQKVLYLCFNEFLLDSMRAMNSGDENITFHNIRTLAMEIMERQDIPIDKIIPSFEEYFDKEYDDSLWPYPNIVVDEGQDLSDVLLEHLAYLMESSSGLFYIFYDRNQAVMKKKPSKWIDEHIDCRLVLYRNCRNTAEIAHLISNIVPINEKNYVNDIHGNVPQVITYRDSKGLQTIAANFVKDMLVNGLKVDDIVILSIHRAEATPLHELTSLAGVQLSYQRESKKIWVTSIRKFKGLEAHAVLIVDLRASELNDDLIRRIFYVGCSRANTYLRIALKLDADDKYTSKDDLISVLRE